MELWFKICYMKITFFKFCCRGRYADYNDIPKCRYKFLQQNWLFISFLRGYFFIFSWRAFSSLLNLFLPTFSCDLKIKTNKLDVCSWRIVWMRQQKVQNCGNCGTCSLSIYVQGGCIVLKANFTWISSPSISFQPYFLEVWVWRPETG